MASSALRPSRAEVVHVVDQHDAVVDHDAHQDEQADLGHQVERRVGGGQHPGGAGQGERDREEDGEGLGQRLEERGHDQVDQDQGEQEVDAHLGVLVGLLDDAVVPAPGVAGRQVEGVHQPLDGLLVPPQSSPS